MKNQSFGVILYALLPLLCIAQAPDTLWTKAYGGSNYDQAFSIQETMDGGYIVTGYTEDFGGGLRNIWLLKTDVNGDTSWTNTFGGTGYHFGHCVQQTSDSGYIITGATSDLSLIADVILIKTDASGNAIWTQTFGGTEYDEGNCVRETSDGGFVVVGMIQSYGAAHADIYIIKTNTNGDSLWAKTYGGALWDEAYSIQETADNGFIIAGYTTLSSGPSGPDTEVYLLKTNANGDSVWAQTYEASATEEYRDYGYSVQQTSDSGYIVVGETWYPGTPAWEIDVYLIKTYPNGDTIWTKTYDRAERTDVGMAVQQTDDGGYIIAGLTHDIGINYDVYLIRTNTNGDTTWTKTIGGSSVEEAWAIDKTADGGYVIAGRTDSYGAGGRDVWLVKTEPDVGIEEHASICPSAFSLHASPNPFTHSTNIRFTPAPLRKARPGRHDSPWMIENPELKIYDATGRLVKCYNIGSGILDGTSTISWCGTDQAGRRLPGGVYFLKFKAEDYSATETLVLIR